MKESGTVNGICSRSDPEWNRLSGVRHSWIRIQKILRNDFFRTRGIIPVIDDFLRSIDNLPDDARG